VLPYYLRKERQAVTMSEINIEKIMDEIKEEAQTHSGEPLPTFAESVLPETGKKTFSTAQKQLNKKIKKEIEVLLMPTDENFYGEVGGGIKGLIRKVSRKLCKGSVAPLRVHTAVTMDEMHQLIQSMHSEIVLLSASTEQLNLEMDRLREDNHQMAREISKLRATIKDPGQVEKNVQE